MPLVNATEDGAVRYASFSAAHSNFVIADHILD
jgi:hypothetical protein